MSGQDLDTANDPRHPIVVDNGLSTRIPFARKEARLRLQRRRLLLRTKTEEMSPPSPIFIVGCPRSGTTLVFSLLAQHEALRSLTTEGHVLWDRYQHPRRKGWVSDRAGAHDIHPAERAYLGRAISAIAGTSRFLDKTPKNVLRIPYLHALFPDLRFIFLRRDGRATVASLIEGWEARRGISYRLPVRLDLVEYKGRFWSYILPPGWREVAGTSIPEVAALQYVASYEIALEDVGMLPPESVIEVSYEDLVASPISEMRRILDRSELGPSEAVMNAARRLDRQTGGSITPPREGKWRGRQRQIERILPTIAPTMSRLGYESGVGR